MKKVTNWFNKKKKQVISNEFDADALPEPPRDIPRYVPKRSSLYNDFKPDDCSSANCKTVNNVSNEIEDETREDQLTSRNPSDLNLSATTQEHIEGESNNSLEEIARIPVNRPAINNNDNPTLSVSNIVDNNSSDSLNLSNSTNNMAVQEADSMQDFPSDLISKKIINNKKSDGNTYVITISNSTHFHIGTQKTINYPGAEGNDHKKGFSFRKVTSGELVELDGNQMLDIKDRLSEDDLQKISLSVGEKWRELARNLGLEESAIQELEDMNDNQYNVIVYDILHQYMDRYPATSVGFMVNILRKSNEFEAIRKLTDKR